MRIRWTAIVAMFVAVAAACGSSPAAVTPLPTALVTTPEPTSIPTTSALASFAPSTYDGADVVWPRRDRTAPAPPALGAIRTTATVNLIDGGTLPSGLILPRVGGTSMSPVVLTPCDRSVRIADGSAFEAIPAAASGETLVVIDPGHGGHEIGAQAPDGTHEATRTLQLAQAVGDRLAGKVDRVVLTRTADTDVSLPVRVALADALRADLAVSVHLNAMPDGPAGHPGTATFASVADPNGRRAAGVLFEAERRYLDTLTPLIHGAWVANRDAGALYRLGSRGDYYFLLRNSHVTWVISESLYISNAPEAGLVARPDVRSGLAGAITNGIVSYVTTDAPGSGWREPIVRPSVSGRTTPYTCVDPP